MKTCGHGAIDALGNPSGNALFAVKRRCAVTRKSKLSSTEPANRNWSRIDLSFTDPETSSFGLRGQKPRVYSLGINPYSHSSEYRPVPCCLETRGANGEIAGEGGVKRQRKSSLPNMGTEASLSLLLTAIVGGFAMTLARNKTQRHSAVLKSAGQNTIGLLPLNS